MSFYQKYRPQNFNSLVGEDHIRDTLLSAVKEGRVSHAYLFSGPRGTGKTSTARILAKVVNCSDQDKKTGESCGKCQLCLEITSGKSLDIIEIDAASNRGIEEIRELREKVKFSPTSSKYKIFIIDEVHMLTLPAFNALLKTLEEPPSHAIFILATTEAHKIPATILSRVQRFDFRRVSQKDIIKNLKSIAKSENIGISDQALQKIAVIADGSHRDSISLFEQISALKNDIEIDDVVRVLGLAKNEEVFNLLERIFASDADGAIKIVDSFSKSGAETSQIIKEIIESLRQVLLYKISDGEVDLEIDGDQEVVIKKIAEAKSSADINSILGIFIVASQRVKETSVKSLPLEMAVVESSLILNSGEKSNQKEKEDKKAELSLAKSEKPKEKKPEIPETEKPKKIIENLGDKSEKETDKSTSNFDSFSQGDWEKVLSEMKKENHTLSALLRDAYPDGVSEDQLRVNVKFKFHLDKISENRNCQLIEQILEKVSGKKYRLLCQIADRKNNNRNKSINPDLEKAASEIFETEE